MTKKLTISPAYPKKTTSVLLFFRDIDILSEMLYIAREITYSTMKLRELKTLGMAGLFAIGACSSPETTVNVQMTKNGVKKVLNAPRLQKTLNEDGVSVGTIHSFVDKNGNLTQDNGEYGWNRERILENVPEEKIYARTFDANDPVGEKIQTGLTVSELVKKEIGKIIAE